MPKLTEDQANYLTQLVQEVGAIGQAATTIANNGFIDPTAALVQQVQTFETNTADFLQTNDIHGKLAHELTAIDTAVSGLTDSLANHDNGAIGTAIQSMDAGAADVSKILAHHFEHLWDHS